MWVRASGCWFVCESMVFLLNFADRILRAPSRGGLGSFDRVIVKMLPSPSKILATAFLLSALAACGTSSKTGAKIQEFGMSVCSLGCNGSSFATNSHPANMDISFTFNDKVDPTTVNFSSISIVDKATGITPTGSFLVSGNVVIFRPSLIETNSGIQYGFLTGSTYRIQVLDDASANAVAATSGRLNQTFITGDITIVDPTDLVPGPPSLLSISPDEQTIPATRNFNIVLTFGDVMQTLLLANPDTGQSALISISTFDSATGKELNFPGVFTAVVDRDALQTVVTFVPDIPFPGDNGGTRVLRVSLSQQIADLVGNVLSNAGTRILQLPAIASSTGSLTEDFLDNAKEDDSGSTAGLWSAVAGALDSGQDPLTGKHHGGGSGILGHFEPTASLFVFDTDSHPALNSSILGETVLVQGGVFPFSDVLVPAAVRIEAVGSNPLRIFAQGSLQIDGVMDLSGEDAPTHRGKVFYTGEWDNEASFGGSTFLEADFGRITDANGVDANALGGAPGIGSLGSGSGGVGGQAWYYNNVRFDNTGYLNSLLVNWQGALSGAGNPNPARFRQEIRGSEFCGSNAEGVGGVAPAGLPLSGDPNNLHVDQDNGSGMGSWCWPPTSDAVTDSNFLNGVKMRTHPTAFSAGVPTAFGDFAIHRARGGGGGGYWTDGGRGTHFDPTATDPLGQPLAPNLEPLADPANNVVEFNGDGLGGDYYMWDVRLGPSASLPDADGGRYVPVAGIETLDPEAGLLLGGSGGGGAGMSEYGSIENRFSGVDGEVGTFRNCPGAGGGAGGGALQLHAGSRLSVNGSVLLDGGRGGDSEFMISIPFSTPDAINFGPPGDAGGGGGSGGAALLQAGSLVQAGLDAISVKGGPGGLGSAGNHGGDGGGGLVRFDTGTGSESLSLLQGFVVPDTAVDLAPIGFAGQPNVGTISVSLPGVLGDVIASDGTQFNGNASGVRSRWYEPPANIQNLEITGWQIDVEYFDGAVQTLSFSNTNPTDPDATPIWIAFQGGWLAVGESSQAVPNVLSQTNWIIPSVKGVSDGLTEINATILRGVRYMLVFDQDQINTLIGGVAGGYFRVTRVSFDYLGD